SRSGTDVCHEGNICHRSRRSRPRRIHHRLVEFPTAGPCSPSARILELEARHNGGLCCAYHLVGVVQFLLHQFRRSARFDTHLSSLAQARGRAFTTYSSMVFLSATTRMVSSGKESCLERRIDPRPGNSRCRDILPEGLSLAPFHRSLHHHSHGGLFCHFL